MERRSKLRVKWVVMGGISLLLSTGCALVHKRAAPANPPPAKDPELEMRLARTELRVLEREAQIEELQARLDEARLEVVRAMAKLQTLATRAEAASGLAEAELAVQGLRRRAGRDPSTDVAQATQLIKMSTAEFDRQNYGGALYLANQAKSLANSRHRAPASDHDELRSDEYAFAVPLRLRVVTVSNVRAGPGTGFRIAFTLAKGTAVVGYSSTGEWVRISDDSGRAGWIFLPLIGPR